MNRREIKTFDQLKNEVLDIKEDVGDIKLCLLGNPKKPLEEPGLVGVISNNKRWRNVVNKVLGGTGTISIGLLVKEFFEYIKKG